MADFSERMKILIGDRGISQFSRQVGLGESLVRKYLKGSEPSLARASQIAQRANCSLEWLATGEGYPCRKAEVIDTEALKLAISFTKEYSNHETDSVQNIALMKLIIANYQYLKATRNKEGEYDLSEARNFAEFLSKICEPDNN